MFALKKVKAQIPASIVVYAGEKPLKKKNSFRLSEILLKFFETDEEHVDLLKQVFKFSSQNGLLRMSLQNPNCNFWDIWKKRYK